MAYEKLPAPWTPKEAQEYLADLRAGAEEMKRVAANVERPEGIRAGKEEGVDDRNWRIALVVLIASILAWIGGCSLLWDLDKGNNEPSWQDREVIERDSGA